MPKDPLHTQIIFIFSSLNSSAATKKLPAPGALKDNLATIIGKKEAGTFHINTDVASQFATASVEMWQRSVHSLLISASLAKASPLWSSVAGYYSSHYTVRAYAHLLGYFLLYKAKRTVKLELSSSSCKCFYQKKSGNEREHKYYWKIVKNAPSFINDPFFTINDENLAQSDGGHRNKANYFDHINGIPKFQILDEKYLKSRIQTIASMQINDPPIPRPAYYPDLDKVQLIAYHRLVTYRKFLDDILGNANKYWTFHRSPNWCSTFIDYQVAKPEYTEMYNGN